MNVRNFGEFLKHSLIEYAVLFMELEVTFIGKGRGFNTDRSADMIYEHQSDVFLQSLPPAVCVTNCSAFMQDFVRLTATTFQVCSKPRYTNHLRQFAVPTEFCTVSPNICWSLVWNLFLVTLPTPRILWWLLDFWKIFAPL
jgi:hypothetical protein